MCLLPANVPVDVVLAFLVLGCEQNPHFRGKCMWHVRVWVWSMPRFMPMLLVTCVAQAQESEALPLGDLWLCLPAGLLLSRLQNQREAFRETREAVREGC